MTRQRRIVIVDGQSPEWRTALDRSPGFACYISPTSLRNPLLWDQLDYARRQGKPVLACVEAGTVLPAGMFAGIKPCLIVEVSSPEETAQWVLRFMQMYLPEEA